MPLWDMSVFLSLRKQRPRFAQSQPKGYFQMKELDRTTKAIVPMNEMWRKLNASMSQYVSLRAKMGQHCSLSAVQRKTAFSFPCHDGLKCLDQCLFVPMAQAPPKAGAKGLLYSLNLIHEFR